MTEMMRELKRRLSNAAKTLEKREETLREREGKGESGASCILQ